MASLCKIARTAKTLSIQETVVNNNMNFARNAWRQFHCKWTPKNSFNFNRVMNSGDLVRMLRAVVRGPAGQTFCRSATIFKLLARQCNVYAAQRLRRMEQILSLYRSIYSEKSLQSLAAGFARRHLKGRRRPFYFFLFGGACFVWDREKISDQQLDSCLEDVELINRLSCGLNPDSVQLASWENVITKAHLMVWRRRLDTTYLYEYKVFGRFTDCTAKSFFKVQLDLEYRKKWDNLAIDISLVERDPESGSEVIYWSTQFPFPMHSRDYVYIRRSKVFHRHRVMALVSHATDHPLKPPSKQHVRVRRFSSKMVVKPHSSFDENGFDYILTYHDDPQAPFPSAAVSWMTSTGVPNFVEKIHAAAVALDSTPGTSFKGIQPEEYSTSSSSNYC